MAHHLLLNDDNKRLRKVTGSAIAEDITGVAPTLQTPLLGPSYNTSTSHSAHRHSPTCPTGGVRRAALNALQDYTSRERQKKVLHRAAALLLTKGLHFLLVQRGAGPATMTTRVVRPTNSHRVCVSQGSFKVAVSVNTLCNSTRLARLNVCLCRHLPTDRIHGVFLQGSTSL
ncbi:hypothetical protein KUCAC02_010458 [Chaenocephalus aceratus]|uniref:Uncharacterized protein n=1 Tax=Chaenocephalus aceratus TaxID=36190 RepID=A0ACB9W0E1_CHAAC|nr:hypothetical protein KUCAC02_010458 [Chaenocephalus aceratus]